MTPSSPTRELPFTQAVAIVPDDVGAIQKTQAVYVGGAGNLRVLMAGDQDVVFVGVPAGAILPIAITRVWATNTTAATILGLNR